MVIQRAFRYRLYPTVEQASAMEQTAGAVRFVYNLALEQRRDFWRQAKARGVRLNYVTQGHEVTHLRAQCDWLAACHSTPLIQALRDLDRAFARFFAGGGFPEFRSKARRASFRHHGSKVAVKPLNHRWSMVRVPKIGFVKMRSTRAMRGRAVSVTFSRDALGWHASFTCAIEHEMPKNDLPAVGIDRGTERYKLRRPEERDNSIHYLIDRLLSGEEVAKDALEHYGLRVSIREAVKPEII